MGYKRVIIYTLERESGASLMAVGAKFDAEVKPTGWNRPNRKRKEQDVYFKRKKGGDYCKVTEKNTEQSGVDDKQEPSVSDSQPQQQKGVIVVTIDHIARIIKPELKELMRQRKMKTKEVIEFWKKYRGNQDRMIEALKLSNKRIV